MNSVLSYPNRGPFGKASYRGNCSGYVVRDLIAQYTSSAHNLLIVDPMEGGGTTGEVCKSLNTEKQKVDYVGLDLSSGFNILSNELSKQIRRPADFIFIHPPYHDMLKYSGTVWGSRPVPGDLSNCPTYPDFLSKLQLALQNAYRALRPDAYYALLIGDLRRNGEYFHIGADIRQLAPGELSDVIIKEQHNCVSDKTTYSKQSFVRIAHEYIFVFHKPAQRPVDSALDTALAASTRLQILVTANWKGITETALQQLGGQATFAEICLHLERNATPNTKRLNWQTKVLATLGRHAQELDNHVWKLKEI